MIKINLLDSVTDRPRGSVAVVEEKVANPLMQTLLLAVVVIALTIGAMGYDFVTAHSDKLKAQKELETQQAINAKMLAINKERAELERKTQEIQVRIDAIQKLRASQQGPVAVLKEVKDRLDSSSGIYLDSIEQKGDQLTIKGGSPNEVAVTRFGQSMEFSSGLFNNLDIETKRAVAPELAIKATELIDDKAPKPEIVTFTIKCSYTPSNQPSLPSAAPAANQAANHVAKN